MMHKTSKMIIGAAVAAALGGFGPHAFAQFDTESISSGNWSDTKDDAGNIVSTRWSLNEPTNTAVGSPNGAATFAIINQGHTITIDQPRETALRVDLGTGTDPTNVGNLVMTAGDLTISEPDGDAAGSFPSLRVGVSSVGNATITNGTITAADEVLVGFGLDAFGAPAPGVGTLTIGGGGAGTSATVSATGRGVVVGVFNGGKGTINLREGGTLNSFRNLDIGRFRNNTTGQRANGTVNMTGGTINVTAAGADLTVGFAADGRFDVSGNSVVNVADNLVIGIDPGRPPAATSPLAPPPRAW